MHRLLTGLGTLGLIAWAAVPVRPPEPGPVSARDRRAAAGQPASGPRPPGRPASPTRPAWTRPASRRGPAARGRRAPGRPLQRRNTATAARPSPANGCPPSTDSATGLPIYSFYGPIRPHGCAAAGVDVMLVDLPDVGARYYTYLGTIVDVHARGGAGRHPVVVLDRPDPIGGMVQGNVLDTAYAVAGRAAGGAHAVRPHPGRAARLARRDLGLGGDLTVVPAAGWRRGMTLDQTGLPVVRPSPNLRSAGDPVSTIPDSASSRAPACRWGGDLTLPSSRIGAPWLDPGRVLALVRAPALRGWIRGGAVHAECNQATASTPGTLVAGIRLHVTDRAAYDPTAPRSSCWPPCRPLPGQPALDSCPFRSPGRDQPAAGGHHGRGHRPGPSWPRGRRNGRPI